MGMKRYQNHDPLVRKVLDLAYESPESINSISRACGFSHHTIYQWSIGHSPSVSNLRAVANHLGYTIELKRKK